MRQRLGMPGAVLLLTLGCAHEEPPSEGFLTPYGAFEPARDGQGGLVQWVEREEALRRYRRIQLAPITLWYSNENRFGALPAELLQELRAGFRESLVDALADAYPLTESAAPDVLRLRLALTDVVVSDPGGDGAGVEGAAIELEAVDSVSGKRIAAFIDRKTLAPGDASVEDLFRAWATRLRKRFDAARKSPY